GRRRCFRTAWRRRRTTSTRSAMPTSSMCCACSANGCSKARTSCRRSASTPSATASPPRACGPVSASCTRARSTAASSSTARSPTRARRSCSTRCETASSCAWRSSTTCSRRARSPSRPRWRRHERSLDGPHQRAEAPATPAPGAGMSVLAGPTGAEDLVVRGARVLDPVEGVDSVLDVRIDRGVITEIGVDVDANGHRIVEAAGHVLAPAFVDPHVHLRTPGREDEETIETGTRAAAAGGYCAILAVPNTDPPVDDAGLLQGLRARADAEARVRVGFLAALTKGQAGAELAELGALADAGAAGFTDDGRPVESAGVMRRALQYNAVTGRPIAVHCEEPTLTRGGHAHAGVVAGELGIGGWPALGESVMVGRRSEE